MNPIAQTADGAVRGSMDGGIAVFKGIPYAAPLDGPRRFQAPVPPSPWDGIREATAFSAAVPQPSQWPGRPPVWSPGDSTDCLSVNVWTPDPGANLPVMVWIYGGAFLAGSSSFPQYDGANLARGGVVVVTLNYRVGFEGFGWLPGVPLNRAVLDQLAALRWVRDNIAAFGGDPDAVTIFGESAGATAVALLTATEAGRGLFRRAIAQSVARAERTPEAARATTERIANALGVEPSAEGFDGVPAEAIHRVQIGPGEITPYGPTIDGDLVRGRPWQGLRPEVDLITGFNQDEYRLFTQLLGAKADDPAALGLPPSAVEEYRAAYPGLSEAGLAELILSDTVFRMPSLWCAREHPGRAYLYELTWSSPSLGACHALDVPLTFGTFDNPFATLLLGDPLPGDAEPLSKEIRKAWTSFAATGDPGWPEYHADTRLARVWDVPSRIVSDPEESSRRIWDAVKAAT
ncbi:carboxylesterase/lipase family protein [Amycolatopsis pigmentata]|uniref:Carboxylic ester hydrolase n=1 Tax=Amycolatopsis pigmentata TaxID=450801 RepID=A0ABW5FWD9_9PSEU